jgi:hypothetical protein
MDVKYEKFFDNIIRRREMMALLFYFSVIYALLVLTLYKLLLNDFKKVLTAKMSFIKCLALILAIKIYPAFMILSK